MKSHRAGELAQFLHGVVAISCLILSLSFFTHTVWAGQSVTNTDESGAGSLRAAVDAAGQADTITFDESLAGRTISLLTPVTNATSTGALVYTVTDGGYVLVAPGAMYTGTGLVQQTAAAYNRAYGGGLFIAGDYSGSLTANMQNFTVSATNATGSAQANGGGLFAHNLGTYAGTLATNVVTATTTAGTGNALANGGGMRVNNNLGAFSGTASGNQTNASISASGTGVAQVLGGGISVGGQLGSLSGTVSNNTAEAKGGATAAGAYVYGGGLHVAADISGKLTGAIQDNVAKVSMAGGTNRITAYGAGVAVLDRSTPADKNSVGEISGKITGNRIEAENLGTGQTDIRGGGFYITNNLGTMSGVVSGNVLSAEAAENMYAFGGGGYLGDNANTLGGDYGEVSGLVSNNTITVVNHSTRNAVETGTGGGGLFGMAVGTLSGTLSNNTIESTSAAGRATAVGAGGRILRDVGEISGTIIDNSIRAVRTSSDSHELYAGGGGMYIYNDSTTYGRITTGISGTVKNNGIYAENSAGQTRTYGGGIFARMAERIDGEISNNSLYAIAQDDLAHSAGGGAYFDGEVKNLSGTFRDNTVSAESVSGSADGLGGGLFVGVVDSMMISGGAFIDNRASAQSASGTARAEGGAVFLNTDNSMGNKKLTLAPTDGDIIFRGNSVSLNNAVTPNDLHFGREYTGNNSQNNAALIIAGGPYSVQLRGGVSVDMDNGKSFTMAVAAPTGGFQWGGPNNFDAGGGSAVNLASVTVTLLSDYQLSSGNINSAGTGNITVSLASGLNLNLELAPRQQGAALPMFVSPADFWVTGGGKVNVSVTQFTRLDEIVGEWQIVDKNYTGVLATDFNAVSSDLVRIDLRQKTADDLWIAADNRAAVNIVRYNANPNVRTAYNSGALIDIWDRQSAGMEPFAVEAAYRNLLANPQWYVPEAYMTHGWLALDWSRYIGEKSIAYDRWSRGMYEQTASSIASGEATASPSYSPSRPRYRAWGAYVGNDVDQDSHGGYYGYDANLNGALAGLSLDFTPCLTSGVYFSYAGGRAKYDDLQSKIDIDIYQGGLFVDFRPTENFQLGFDASYAWYDNKARRDNQFGSYRGDFDQQVFGAGVNARYNWELSANTRFTPYLTARYQYLRQDGINENGVNHLWATHIGKANADSFTTALGTALTHDFRTSDCSVVTSSLYAAWRHDFGDRQISSTANYVNSPLTYRMSSIERERDSADLGIDLKASFDLKSGRTVEINAGYGINLTRNYVNQSWYAGLGLRF